MKYRLIATALAGLTLVLNPGAVAQGQSAHGQSAHGADMLTAPPSPSPHAQAIGAQAIERGGLWLGGGLGIGHAVIDCVRCGVLYDDDPWEGGLGVAGYFGIGRTFTPRFQAGAEMSLWARRSGRLSRDATLTTIGIGGRYYPIPTADFHLTVGVGLGGSILAGDGLIESPGFGAGIGAGYDISLGGNVALAPFARFVQIVGEGASGRNRDDPAQGPDGPRYVQFGVAFMRY